jgi:hypothetical protein
MAKFKLGTVVATPGALSALEASGETAIDLIQRHVTGDWGDLCAEDKALNDEALIDGSRILSSYVLTSGEKVWIITEAADDNGHRTATTILLPSDY